MHTRWVVVAGAVAVIAVAGFAVQNGELRRNVSEAVTAAVTPEKRIVVPEGTSITVRLAHELSTSDSRVGDTFGATVAEPVTVGDEVVIPAGADISGRVIVAEQPGRVKGRGHLQLRYEVLAIGDDRYELDTRSVMYESPSSAGRDAALIGGGAVAGGIVGGATGGSAGSAVKGGLIGGAAGTAAALATRGPQLVFRTGALLRFRLDRELQVRQRPA